MKNKVTDLTASLAEMLVGGLIIEVTCAEQASLAEAAGASGVMVVSRLAADCRIQGGVDRMVDPVIIRSVQAAVSIPVMAKCRIGHDIEAEILAELGVDYIDESEMLTPVDREAPIKKSEWRTPFIAGAHDLATAMQRLTEGASVIRCSGASGTGDVSLAVQQLRAIVGQARKLQQYPRAELPTVALEMGVSQHLLADVANRGRLPVVTFGAGGVVSPADAALLRRAGADCVMVGSGIFHSADPQRRAAALVTATAHFSDAELIAKVSQGLGREMTGVPAMPSPADNTPDEWGF